MSYRIGIDALHLRPGPRLAHTEYCSNERLKRRVTGMSEDSRAREAAFYNAWDIDLIWHTNDGPEPWEQRGRTTDMGHSEFLEGGADWRDASASPFGSAEDVWGFDAVAEYGLTPMERLVEHYEGLHQAARRDFAEQVFTGGYYRTLISGAIAIFGWEMLLQAAARRDRFTRVLDSIFAQSAHHYRAWAQTSIEVFMCHDDMVWSEGPFMRPDYYRAEVFPRYQALWEILHAAGKKVAFTSDGDYGMFVDDIVAAGADCLCFEPMTRLEPIIAAYGQTHALISSKVDARTLTFGGVAEITAEVDATLALAQQCPGFVFAVGNHIPSNVPVENALAYMAHLRSHWARQ